MEGEKQGWQAIAAQKRQIQESLLSQHSNYKTRATQCENQSNLAGVAAFDELAVKLSRGELNCEDVVKEYICRACKAHAKVCSNCLVWKSALIWCYFGVRQTVSQRSYLIMLYPVQRSSTITS
ncbi:hypothetical protein F5Y12DRAFT_735042 [Xylaria sp. FL1777]|nr:hypothetical protein F5Y12DRAFT_735042 [Xylaria sp. FL1777]